MKICEGVYLVGSGAVGLSHEFDCHVYLIDGGNCLALVDAGAGLGTSRILENVRAAGYDLRQITHILLTHAHPDHAGGAAEIADLLGCRVFSAREEARIVREGSDAETGLEMAKASGGYASDYQYRHCDAYGLSDAEEVEVGRLRIKTIVVPGHSVSSACYLVEIEGRQCLFSGDTVFINGLVGLLNCPGCDLRLYRESIGKLAGLGVDALLPGHLLFTVTGGQANIDKAIAGLRQIQVPPHIGLIG